MTKDKLTELFEEQIETFELARENYNQLAKVTYRDIVWENFSIRLQYNPARMVSTNAKIDKQTLQTRKCFLCRNFMPADQKGIPYGDHYHIFINPFPIFEQHFTVPANQHTPQSIKNRLADMLDLAFDLPSYTLFYNGPQCGASAPDHFHFQIAPRHLMPLEADIENDRLRKVILKKDFYTVFTLNDYLRKVIVLQASDRHVISTLFYHIEDLLRQIIPAENEAMMNILCWFDNCQWKMCIFPRATRRPWQFFAEGEEKVLFSPGCVDMAGLIITPRQEDFNQYNKILLTDLFQQVSVSDKQWQQIISQLRQL